MGGWLEADNRAISVQLNLTGTATGTELGNIVKIGKKSHVLPIHLMGVSLLFHIVSTKI